MRTTSAKPRTRLRERAADDLEAEPRLLVGVLGRVALARDRRRARDVHLAARDDGARVADDRLERRVPRNEAALHGA